MSDKRKPGDDPTFSGSILDTGEAMFLASVSPALRALIAFVVICCVGLIVLFILGIIFEFVGIAIKTIWRFLTGIVGLGNSVGHWLDGVF